MPIFIKSACNEKKPEISGFIFFGVNIVLVSIASRQHLPLV